jgi:FAD/FMN-containing dehydrogenase
MASVTIATREGGSTGLGEGTIERLRSSINGELLLPKDPGFDEAVVIWNAMVQKRPALVVRPKTVGDVVAAVNFARDNGVLLSVKGGGHNIAGTAVAEGGLTLDMSLMRSVRVDPHVRLANVGPGCRLRDVDQATQEHGLATPLGFISKTGVAGLTLGGGMGYLTRRFGFAVDNLVEAEVVTADGKVRVASREQEPDLFWALRGGGGNFGVVTRFTFRLHEVGPVVFGGLIAWPFDRADEVLGAYRRLTAEAPRELSAWLIILRAPPAPFVPPRWHGEMVCAMAACYSGDLGRTEQVLAPIGALQDPVLDLLREQPYTELQSYLDDTEPDGAHYYWKTEYLSGLSDGVLATVKRLAAESPVPMGQIGFLHIGGALNEHAEDDGAVGNRDARFAVGVNGTWAPDEPQAEAFLRWIRAGGDAIREHSTGATYINFQTADEAPDRIRATYGRNYDRLADVKRTYDPENLFRSNRNIAPRA